MNLILARNLLQRGKETIEVCVICTCTVDVVLIYGKHMLIQTLKNKIALFLKNWQSIRRFKKQQIKIN